MMVGIAFLIAVIVMLQSALTKKFHRELRLKVLAFSSVAFTDMSFAHISRATWAFVKCVALPPLAEAGRNMLCGFVHSARLSNIASAVSCSPAVGEVAGADHGAPNSTRPVPSPGFSPVNLPLTHICHHLQGLRPWVKGLVLITGHRAALAHASPFPLVSHLLPSH